MKILFQTIKLENQLITIGKSNNYQSFTKTFQKLPNYTKIFQKLSFIN